jgi:hypothetical protein
VAENSQGLRDFAFPPGVDEVLSVFVNGVEKTAGTDYVVLSDRVRFDPPLQRHEKVSRFGGVLMSVGIGVYPKGDIVDLQVRRHGGVQVVRARPFEDV